METAMALKIDGRTLLILQQKGRATEALPSSSAALSREGTPSPRLAAPTTRSGLLTLLDSNISHLESAINTFSWSADYTLPSHRTSARVAPSLDDALTVETLDSGSTDNRNEQTYRLVSKPLDLGSDHGLRPGLHLLALRFGEASKRVTVSVTQDDISLRDVVTKLQQAIDRQSLPVNTELVTQSAPQTRIANVFRTGTMLALTVSPGNGGDELSVNPSTDLARALDFSAVPQSTLTAQAGSFSAQPLGTFAPSTRVSFTYDRNEQAKFIPGTYAITAKLNDMETDLSVTIPQDATHEDVLKAVGRALNMSPSGASASLVVRDRPVYLGSAEAPHAVDPLLAEGIYLRVTATEPKLGQRLQLTDNVAQSSEPSYVVAIADMDSEPGLLQTHKAGEQFIALNEGGTYDYHGNHVALTRNYIHFYDGQTWTSRAPEEDEVVRVRNTRAVGGAGEGTRYVYNGEEWQPFLVEALGLDGSARPGQDARLELRGKVLASETATFETDGGRVLLSVSDTAAPAATVSVTATLDAVEDGLKEIVSAYNDLRSFMNNNRSALLPELFQSLDAPVDAYRDGLSALGLRESSSTGQLWIQGDTLDEALLLRPRDSRSTLLGPTDGIGSEQTGFLNTLDATLTNLRRTGLDAFLIDAPEPANPAELPWRHGISPDLGPETDRAYQDGTSGALLNRKG